MQYRLKANIKSTLIMNPKWPKKWLTLKCDTTVIWFHLSRGNVVVWTVSLYSTSKFCSLVFDCCCDCRLNWNSIDRARCLKSNFIASKQQPILSKPLLGISNLLWCLAFRSFRAKEFGDQAKSARLHTFDQVRAQVVSILLQEALGVVDYLAGVMVNHKWDVVSSWSYITTGCFVMRVELID